MNADADGTFEVVNDATGERRSCTEDEFADLEAQGFRRADEAPAGDEKK